MIKRRNTAKLSRDKAHREALLRNLSQELFLHGKLRTTLAKAKALRPYVEPIITRAKDDTLQSRRLVAKVLYTQEAINKLFTEIAPRFKQRNGGYTRIVKLGPRAGDGAEGAVIQLVESEKAKQSEKKVKKQ
jgi:large subunit ribosomal protein L17